MEKGKSIPFPADKRASVPRPNVYSFRVYLVSGPYGEESVGHEIFRTLKVRGDQTLEDLHHAIFCSFGRENDRYIGSRYNQGFCAHQAVGPTSASTIMTTCSAIQKPRAIPAVIRSGMTLNASTQTLTRGCSIK